MEHAVHLRRLPLYSSVLFAAFANVAVQDAAASSTAECFDFNDIAVDASFAVGSEPLQTTLGEVRVQSFSIDAEPIEPDTGLATIVQSGLPTGTPPSLKLESASVQVRLHAPATAITVDFAQNTGLDDRQRQNFGINGDRRTDLVGGFEQLDGDRLGLAAFGGEASITVFTDPDSDSLPTYERGHLHASALDQGINVFDIGGHSFLLVDNICVHMN